MSAPKEKDAEIQDEEEGANSSINQQSQSLLDARQQVETLTAEKRELVKQLEELKEAKRKAEMLEAKRQEARDMTAEGAAGAD